MREQGHAGKITKLLILYPETGGMPKMTTAWMKGMVEAATGKT